MLDMLMAVAQRPIVITLAILGALLVTAGSLAAGSNPKAPPRPIARFLSLSGYVITMVSVVLFITAGFLVGR
ncbi:MAG: hypothetical protein KDJ37_09440 [Hyphomicrobiaceae bacterium]|nr:hypothetical protein [Hyphomicrobiaceae bacterium]